MNSQILQVRPNAFDVFESIRSQVRLLATYSARDMQRDMIKYMKRNKEELEVGYISHFKYSLMEYIVAVYQNTNNLHMNFR